MSKAVIIYEVNFELLSRHVPGLLIGYEALKPFCFTLTTAPETIDAEGYSRLITFLSGNLLSDHSRYKELAELGISEIETFHPTYRAVVFMELFCELMPEQATYSENNLYQLSKDRFLLFTEILLLYKEIFQLYEDPKTEVAPFYDVSPAVREQYTTAGKQLLERETESRNTLGEDYSGKWFAQYFHFFETLDAEGLKASALNGKGNVYLIDDSY